MNKKLGFLSLLSVMLPLSAVLACGQANDALDIVDNQEANNEEGQRKYEYNGTIMSDWAPIPPIPVPSELKNFEVPEDGFYLVASDYNGTLWNGDTRADGSTTIKKVVKIDLKKGFALNPSIMLGEGDAVYFLLDDDENDGINKDNLFENFGFEDTSISAATSDNNKDLGNIPHKGMFGTTFTIPFKPYNDTSGFLNNYVGSQSNHATGSFQSALKNMEKYAPKDAFDNILKYYGFKNEKDSNGDFLEDASIVNHASRAFLPINSFTQAFNYNILDEGIVRITTNLIGGFTATAAAFRMKENGQNWKSYGSLSIGDKTEWDSYIRHNEAKYIGIKDIY